MDEKTTQYKGREIVTFDGSDSGNRGWFWQADNPGYSTYTNAYGPFNSQNEAIDAAKNAIDAGNC